MNTLAQIMLVFTTSAGGNLPSQIEMETTATQSLAARQIVTAPYQFGIRSSGHDFAFTRVGRKDESDGAVSEPELRHLADDVAAKTGCKLSARHEFTAPVISETPDLKVTFKPYHRLEFACP